MSKIKFSSLKEEQKKYILKKKGSVLNVKAKELFTFILYKIADFYIEAMYNNRFGGLVITKAYKSTKHPGSYLAD